MMILQHWNIMISQRQLRLRSHLKRVIMPSMLNIMTQTAQQQYKLLKIIQEIIRLLFLTEQIPTMQYVYAMIEVVKRVIVFVVKNL